MCLLFALSDTSKVSQQDLQRLLLMVSSEFGRTQRDGFGFALGDANSPTPYIERYAKPTDFMGPGRLAQHLQEAGWMGKYALHGDWEQSGDWSKLKHTGPLIVHGRTATSGVALKNTHPFHKNGWTLAHNGVVQWHGPKLPLESTCDSEHLLNCYTSLQGPASFGTCITGWFATLAIDPAGMLRVAKCAMTDLYFAWSPKWQTYVFSTNAPWLVNVSTMLSLDCTRPLALEPYVELTLKGNDCAGALPFDPPRVNSRYSAQAERALGKPVYDADDAEPSESTPKRSRSRKSKSKSKPKRARGKSLSRDESFKQITDATRDQYQQQRQLLLEELDGWGVQFDQEELDRMSNSELKLALIEASDPDSIPMQNAV